MSTGIGSGFTFTGDKNPFEVSDNWTGKESSNWQLLVMLNYACDADDLVIGVTKHRTAHTALLVDANGV